MWSATLFFTKTSISPVAFRGLVRSKKVHREQTISALLEAEWALGSGTSVFLVADYPFPSPRFFLFLEITISAASGRNRPEASGSFRPPDCSEMLLYEITSRSAILLILDVVFDADSRGSNRLANLELFSAYLVVSRLAHGELSYATYCYPPRSREIRHG